MITERLKGPRALQTIIPPPGMPLALCDGMINPAQAYAATESPQRRTLHLVSTEDPDLRDTLPPTAETEPPPAFTQKPSETLKLIPGYDDNTFLHVALVAAADAAHEMRESRKAFDADAIIDRARLKFEQAVTAGYEMIRGPVAETLAEVKALAPRVKATEDGLADLRTEFDSMKARMVQIELALGIKTAP